MLSLEHENYRDGYCRDITHGQPIGKQISYRLYKRIASFRLPLGVHKEREWNEMEWNDHKVIE